MVDDVLKDLQANLDKATDALKRDLAKVRTGRANLALLDGIKVEYYGTMTPLNQVAALNVPDPRLITIKPWEKSMCGEIEKAIRQRAELGLNPSSDGELVRVPIPPLTQERRRDLVKHIRKVAEEFRVSLRNHRRDANDLLKELQKDGDITEDDLRRGHDKTQELTKDYTDRLDKVLKAKEDEIMEV